jgi:hypothetical protein
MLLAVSLLFLTIPVVYAQDSGDEGEFNILEIPKRLGTALGIKDPDMASFVGGLIASTIVLFAGLLTIILITSKPFAHLMMGIVILSTCTALTWLPFWVLLIIVVLIGLMFSGQVRHWITGAGGKGD